MISLPMFHYGTNLSQIFSGNLPLCDIISDGAVVLAVANGTPLPRPEGVDDFMWDLTLSCCEMEPAKRPTAGEVVEILRSRPELGVDERTVSDWDDGFIASLRSLAEHPDLSGPNVWD